MRIRLFASSAVVIAAGGLFLSLSPALALPFGESISAVDVAAGALAGGRWSLYRILTLISCVGLAFAVGAGIWVIVRLRASAALLALIACVAVLGSSWIVFLVVASSSG